MADVTACPNCARYITELDRAYARIKKLDLNIRRTLTRRWALALCATNTITGVAALCDVSRQTVHEWLDGQAASKHQLQRLAKLSGQTLPDDNSTVAGGVGELEAALENIMFPAAENEPRLSDASRDVIAERRRQTSVEGWSEQHDDEHMRGTLCRAAQCYLQRAFVRVDGLARRPPSDWPWGMTAWKPKNDPRRNLVRAAALVIAEIERLDRGGGEGDG